MRFAVNLTHEPSGISANSARSGSLKVCVVKGILDVGSSFNRT